MPGPAAKNKKLNSLQNIATLAISEKAIKSKNMKAIIWGLLTATIILTGLGSVTIAKPVNHSNGVAVSDTIKGIRLKYKDTANNRKRRPMVKPKVAKDTVHKSKS
jgi:hypothetical protein